VSPRKNARVLVRFTAADASDWTVWDVTWSKGKHHRRPHGDPTATHRVFVNADGVKRAYTFKPSDSRVLEEQALGRQLNAAAFLPTSEEDNDTYSLTEGERLGPPTFRGPRAKGGASVSSRRVRPRAQPRR
jgi:hypothetical protein